MTARSTAIELLWGRPVPPTRGPRPTLRLEAITAAGIELADAGGLAAVTMQRVAESLGVTKMALYRYVPGKDELVALMTDHALGVPPQLPSGGWRAGLDAWARHMFARFSAHPWTLEATVGSRPIGPNELDWMERATAALTGTGLTGPQILDVAATLTGHVRMVAQQGAAVPESAVERHMAATIGALLAERAERYPALTAALASPEGQDRALDFGLSCILTGVEALIGSSPDS
ncbi:TetR/AcrR family transcriptional regulator [Actinocorallia sp. A-T 12471]|uniref:TetR/AcrR family transcriptional regulator n=1 Tax=Actinocorallia sp. A-T 12471 TaxID=3089813 RepID=UPI0029CDCA4F|nr:TetR/AcrR family transcriptional regulator [Actinocorallia sp. A-T 12471]MDX6743375.1 TetR/AcrR family transcriptional regulator [Actinocorallia sp. A-T 12471]